MRQGSLLERQETETRQDTGIVSRLLHRLGPDSRTIKPSASKIPSNKNGVYRTERLSVQIAPDGYIRKSPVQPMRIPQGYHARRIRKILFTAIGVITAVAVLYLLFDRLNYILI